MLRTSGSDSARLRLIFGILFIFVACFPGLTLFSGQVIKQFETYSLAESMSQVGWNPFATTIPCDGGIRWVLELPIYAGLGGLFVALAPRIPSLFPISVFGFFLIALFRLRARLAPKTSSLVWTAVAATPVFLRFAPQFLADPLALVLLLFGAAFFLEKRNRPAFWFFLLAVSVKPTVLPSILFFRWAFCPERNPRALFPPRPGAWLAREAITAIGIVAPFVIWSLTVRLLGIPSPMHEGGIMAIGKDWEILGTRSFYSKFFVWTVFKGVGIPLFILAVFGTIRAWRTNHSKAQSDRILRLAAWSVGIVPYWLLVRRLNVIHDYYSLSFFAPIAILGALAADELIEFTSLGAKVLREVLLLSAGWGAAVFALAGQQVPVYPDVGERPVFCGKEFRSENLMGLPLTVENR